MEVGVTDAAQKKEPVIDIYANQDVLDKNAFLELLVTQLRHQDPLNPMENTEFISQLAQFSSLEQMQNVSTGINEMSALMQSVNNSMATSLIGKDVKYIGDTFKLADGKDGKMTIYLQEKASVKIDIYDENDLRIRTVVQGDLGSGLQSVKWDGIDMNGERAANGRYRYEVKATNSDGEDVSVATFGVDRVTGLKFDKGNAVLMLEEREVNLGDILEIMESID